MNAIGYIRISKKDQSNYSLEYQERIIREYCERNNVELKAIFVDDGESSYTFDRPDYKALESFIKEHKNQVRYLVILDHDRFSRNLPEALMKIDQLENKFAIKVVATSESLDIDTSDPAVFMQRAFKYLVANQELFTIRRRAKLGIRQAQSSGRYVNKAPFGYKNSQQPDGRSLIVVDEANAFIVQKIFRDYLAGIPVYLIKKDVRSMGFPNSGNSAIYRVLANPLYAGLVRVTASNKEPERIVKGLHEPIISQEQFWLAQEMLNHKRSMTSQPKEEFPLKGLVQSPCCGGPLTAGWTKGKLKYYLYYRCIKHSNVNIPGTKLHEKFNQLLKGLNFTKGQVEKISLQVKQGLKQVLLTRAARLKMKNDELAVSSKKLDGLEEKLISDQIDGNTFKKWSRKLNMEIARIKEDVRLLNSNIEAEINKQLQILPSLLDLSSIYHRANIIQQHTLFKAVFKQGITFRDGAFRTPYIHPEFAHNLLTLNKKGLLFLEQPKQDLSIIPSCGESGIRTRGTIAHTHAFQACSFSHSDTSPCF